MWGWLLLHFIRMLIQRLFNRRLCLYPLTLCSPHQLQVERICSETGDVGRGSVRFTSHHLSSVLQFRAVHPGCSIHMSALFIFMSLSAPGDHTSVISTSSVLSLFSCCRRGCCLGGGGAARTCENKAKKIGKLFLRQ